jgi:glycosyltransferase involved in cell wall biosynthesis
VNSSYYWGFLRDGAIVWLSSRMGARVLMHLHGGDFDVFLEACPGPVRWLVLKTLRRCQAVVVLTRDTQAQLARLLDPERVHHLPNFVRTELFSRSGPTERDPAAKVEVLFVGWVIGTKGVRELLEAARSLPGARFTLVGPIDPDFQATVSGELEELGERVRLLGRLSHEETAALYGQCDVFVLPTYREGFPVSVLEAMAASLPVVATPVGAIPDVVREGHEGHLVPVRDASALARRLRELVEDPARRRAMGCAARERVERYFSVEIVVAELEALYDSLLGAGGAG